MGATAPRAPGQRHGTFQAAQNYTVGASPSSVAVGDLTPTASRSRDGKPGSYPGYAGSVSVLLGNGDGTFRIAGDFAAGSQGPVRGGGRLQR